jgi:quercetin dioxygenase-like cupin family protein
MRKKIMLSAVLAVLVGVVAIQAQAPAPSGIKRNVLVKDEMAPMPAMTGYLIEVELAPGAESGWHTHPGHDFDYVRSGEAILEVKGKPPQTLKAGMGIHTEPGVLHNARNPSKTEPFKYVAFFVIEQGKPVTIPAPAPAKK